MFEEVPREPQAQPEPAGDSRADVTDFTKESVDAMRSQLKESDRERKQFREMAQRAQADLMNFRRRVEEEREDVVKQAGARLVAKLLPVADELRLALDHARKQDAHAAWLEGVALVQQKLLGVLESEGIQRISPSGQRFDPWEHEALMYVPAPQERDGTVLEVVREGYKLHGRLIRPAQVIVAKTAEPSTLEQHERGEDRAQ